MGRLRISTHTLTQRPNSWILLLCADIVIRVMPTTSELKLGVAAALFGAPVFVWIAIRRNANVG